ncbi:hypothetical protein F2Q69_00022905 [Brassica cretica]|uniref:Uncharacterized protein n=1 Tax=Brassica cretica TaxID=69181 RepID=A0A8S9QU63_BRACR|nr:hypothetical protein F2Q69_00022905 [Brassica cretica]
MSQEKHQGDSGHHDQEVTQEVEYFPWMDEQGEDQVQAEDQGEDQVQAEDQEEVSETETEV